MTKNIFDTYHCKYVDYVKISCKLNITASHSATYLLNKFYKERAVKTKQESTHG